MPRLGQTLTYWRLFEPATGQEWHPATYAYWLDHSSEKERRISFPDAAWAVSEETRPEAKARILAELTAHLDTELDRIETLALGRGWEKTPVKRARSGPADLHFEWLVLRHVEKLSYREIADRHSGEELLNEDAIRKAVESTAALVGLTPRN